VAFIEKSRRRFEMRIEVKYSVSQGPHVVDISLDDMNQMLESGSLTLSKPTQGGTKTITISGTAEELNTMAKVLQRDP
jgi:hypothetical protein